MTVIVFIEPILTKFTDIATHVVNAEFVGRFRADSMRLESGIPAIPCNGIGVVAAAIFIAPAIVAAACRKLPLRLGRQTVVLTRAAVLYSSADHFTVNPAVFIFFL